MPVRPIVLAILGLFIAAPASAGAPAKVVYAPAPSWVRPIVADTVAKAQEGNLEYRLIDHQVNRTLDPPEAYRHYSIAALNEQGVPEISKVACEFAPDYETLLVHDVRLLRGGRTIPVPFRGRFELLHREEQLEDQIYDGRLTAVLVLDDVRPGDVLEYSYTIRGANPVLAGHYGLGWPATNWSPVRLSYRRLLWPAARPIRLRVQPPGVEPIRTQAGETVEFQVMRKDAAATDVESGIPGWYNPFGGVEFSDASSWNEIARWSTTLFPAADAPLSPLLRQRVAAFVEGETSREAQAMRAIRFVQDEVRYLGIEVGENSHRAAAPEIVLKRRFGDCKDKALLLVTFLRALGYDAQPALVHSSDGDSTGASGPSVFAFNHVVVRFRDPGRTGIHWVDATAGGQRGTSLSHLPSLPNGRALVVSESSENLVRIVPSGEPALTTIEKDIDAADQSAPAKFTVATTYYGSEANSTRSRLRAIGRERMSKDYLEYYRQNYPKLETASPVVIEDDEAQNRIRIEERYTIPGFWSKEDGASQPSADCSAYELVGFVPKSGKSPRTMPLGLADPFQVRYDATIRLPANVEIRSREERVDTPNLNLTMSKSKHDGRVHHHVEIVNRGGDYTVEQANAAAPRFQSMYTALDFAFSPEGDVTSASEPGAGIDPLALGMAFLGIVIGLGCAWIVYRAPSPATIWPNVQFAEGSAPWLPDQPIGGWLYVFGFGVLIAPLVILLQSINAAIGLRRGSVFGANGFPTAYGLSLLEAAVNALIFVGSILALVLFLQRSRKFFRFYVGYRVLSIVFGLFDLVLAALLTPDAAVLGPIIRTQVSGIFAVLIWSQYFVRSRRVEATFVR